MSSVPSRASVLGRDVARVRSAAHEVGRAHHARRCRPRARRRGGLDGGRELGDGDAVGDRLGDVVERGVVVARERDAVRLSQRDQARRLRLAALDVGGDALRDERLKLAPRVSAVLPR